jgi:hypothetical protein
MTNPNNLKDLSSELENVLDAPVSTKILEKLTPGERGVLVRLIYKWTQGAEVIESIKLILNRGKKEIPKFIPYRDRPVDKIFN